MKTPVLSLSSVVCRIIMDAAGSMTKSEIEAEAKTMGADCTNLSQVLHALRTADVLVKSDEGEGRRFCYLPGDLEELRSRAGDAPSASSTPAAARKTPARKAAPAVQRAAATAARSVKTARTQPVAIVPPAVAREPASSAPELAAAKFVYAISEHGDLQIAAVAGDGVPAVMECDDVLRLLGFVGLAWPIIVKARPELAGLFNPASVAAPLRLAA